MLVPLVINVFVEVQKVRVFLDPNALHAIRVPCLGSDDQAPSSLWIIAVAVCLMVHRSFATQLHPDGDRSGRASSNAAPIERVIKKRGQQTLIGSLAIKILRSPKRRTWFHSQLRAMWPLPHSSFLRFRWQAHVATRRFTTCLCRG